MTNQQNDQVKPFDFMVEESNHTYARKKWAFVNKVEPPIDVKHQQGDYVAGWWYGPVFADYFGISNGRALAFSAKSTNDRTCFYLSNLDQEEMEALQFWKEQGGISFLLIEFRKHYETYLVPFEKLVSWWDGQFKGGRTLIPYHWFVHNCDLVKPNRGVILDYLSLVDLP